MVKKTITQIIEDAKTPIINPTSIAISNTATSQDLSTLVTQQAAADAAMRQLRREANAVKFQLQDTINTDLDAARAALSDADAAAFAAAHTHREALLAFANNTAASNTPLTSLLSALRVFFPTAALVPVIDEPTIRTRPSGDQAELDVVLRIRPSDGSYRSSELTIDLPTQYLDLPTTQHALSATMAAAYSRVSEIRSEIADLEADLAALPTKIDESIARAEAMEVMSDADSAARISTMLSNLRLRRPRAPKKS